MEEFIAKWTFIAMFIIDIIVACVLTPDGETLWGRFFLILFVEIIILLAIGLAANESGKTEDTDQEQKTKTKPVDTYTLGLRASAGDEQAWKELVDFYREEYEKNPPVKIDEAKLAQARYIMNGGR